MSTDTKPPQRIESGHWYQTDGKPLHFVPKKDGSGDRPTTLADAKKLNLLPSVTGILKVLAKPALQDWLIRQAVMAVTTAPDVAGEDLDAKITRVLDTERQQDIEGRAAADLGTRIHGAIEDYFLGREVPEDLKEWIMPAVEELLSYGKLVATEKIVVGDGYAGKMDLWLEDDATYWLWDAKSAKKLPDPKKGGAWLEHRLQLSAYAQGTADLLATTGGSDKPIRTANIYISTITKGQFVVCEHEDWQTTFISGFAPLVTYWQFANNHRPKLANAGKVVSARAVAGQVRELIDKHPVAPEPAAAPAVAEDEPPTSATPPSPPPPKHAAGKTVVWTEGRRS